MNSVAQRSPNRPSQMEKHLSVSLAEAANIRHVLRVALSLMDRLEQQGENSPVGTSFCCRAEENFVKQAKWGG